MGFVVQNYDKKYSCSLWLKRLHMIFTSTGAYNKPYSLYFSSTVSGFNLKKPKFSADFGDDLQQVQTS